MKICYIFVLVGILMMPSLAFSADNALEFRVKLNVHGDESIASPIKRYLSEEIQSLNDVIQSNDHYRYNITVIGGKLKNTGGDGAGVVLSVNIHTKFDNQHFSYMFKEEFVKEGMSLTNGLFYYPKHWVRSGSIHDLPSICRRIIADFDSQILQKQRDAIKGGKIYDLDSRL
ncbi:MAG: hypothetical protein JW896_01000 [Deltaproteobacteria bacterium]|nr:hypothetical protein [Deltaproteobacteria bacterium]